MNITLKICPHSTCVAPQHRNDSIKHDYDQTLFKKHTKHTLHRRKSLDNEKGFFAPKGANYRIRVYGIPTPRTTHILFSNLAICKTHHFTTSPLHHLTTSPPHHLTTSPPYHLTNWLADSCESFHMIELLRLSIQDLTLLTEWSLSYDDDDDDSIIYFSQDDCAWDNLSNKKQMVPFLSAICDESNPFLHKILLLYNTFRRLNQPKPTFITSFAVIVRVTRLNRDKIPW